MKIIIIGPAHPYRGGIADTNENLALALQGQGHEVEMMTFTQLYPELIFPGSTQFREGAAAPVGLKITRALHAYNPFNWPKVARDILASGPDLLIFRYWIPHLSFCYSALAKKLRGKVSMLALVDNATPHESFPFQERFADGFLQRVDTVLVMSDFVKSQLKLAVRSKTSVILHPVNKGLPQAMSKADARAALDLDANAPVVLFFGLVRKYKGLDLLLEALAKTRSLPHVQLVIAGEFYEDRASYDEQIDRLDLAARVHVHARFIPDNELSKYFCAADICALTYHSASQSGVSQMAIHYGLPLLVTDVGGLPEYVQDEVTGFICPKDSGAIASSIDRFFGEGLGESMGAATESSRSRFTWEAFAKGLLELC